MATIKTDLPISLSPGWLVNAEFDCSFIFGTTLIASASAAVVIVNPALFPFENGGDKLVHGSGGISQPRAE